MDEELIEVIPQAVDLQGDLLDVRVPSLSVGQKRSVQLVQGTVKLVLLFESGELVGFVILNDCKFAIHRKSTEICTLRRLCTSWRRASDVAWTGSVGVGEEAGGKRHSYRVSRQGKYRWNVWTPFHCPSSRGSVTIRCSLIAGCTEFASRAARPRKRLGLLSAGWPRTTNSMFPPPATVFDLIVSNHRLHQGAQDGHSPRRGTSIQSPTF